MASSAEALISPALAGAALVVLDGPALFPLSALLFTGSIVVPMLVRLVRGIELPRKAPFARRALRGIRIELRTPRLRGLLIATFGLSLGLSWVLVNTVVLAGLRPDDPEGAYTRLMFSYGLGAALCAPVVPRLVERHGERDVIPGGGVLFALTSPAILMPLGPAGLALLWAASGAAATMVLTPGGLVLRRSARPGDWPALSAAQLSLSHAGWTGAAWGPERALLAAGAAALAVTAGAAWVWPRADPAEREHSHDSLPDDDPHLIEHGVRGPRKRHRHVVRIDDDHPRWTL